MSKNKSRNAQTAINELINSSVSEGVEAIIKDHPRFKNYEDFILKHIDKKKLNHKVSEVYHRAISQRLPSDEAREYMHKELLNYIATGVAFDDAGKEVILKKSLEERAGSGFFKGFFARRKLEGEKYLDNTMEAFQDLYALMQQGNHAERMPELAQPLTTIYNLGFLDPALDVLQHYGLIDKSKYHSIKKSVFERADEARKEVVKGIEKYANYQPATEKHNYQKAAAIFLGIAGLMISVASKNILGATIGSAGNNFSNFVGAALVLISMIWFLKIYKIKKRKYKK